MTFVAFLHEGDRSEGEQRVSGRRVGDALIGVGDGRVIEESARPSCYDRIGRLERSRTAGT